MGTQCGHVDFAGLCVIGSLMFLSVPFKIYIWKLRSSQSDGNSVFHTKSWTAWTAWTAWTNWIELARPGESRQALRR
jgi:hypothetical protein